MKKTFFFFLFVVIHLIKSSHYIPAQSRFTLVKVAVGPMTVLPDGGQACSACPPCVYCRGHHLPSLSLRISAGSHQPPHTPPCLPICLPTRPFFPLSLFSECHITQQHLCCHCVFLFRVSKNDFYCLLLKTKAFDTLGTGSK